jgi:hypothetical protein
MTRWLQANERPVRDRLRAADLGYVLEGASEMPVPLWNVFDFLRQMGVAEGFDIGARVISPGAAVDRGVAKQDDASSCSSVRQGAAVTCAACILTG